MLQKIKDSKKNHKEKNVTISFWFNLNNGKIFIKTTINKEILKNEEELDIFIIDLMKNYNVPLYMKPTLTEEIRNIIDINKMEKITIKEGKENNEDNIQSLIDSFKNRTVKYNKTSIQPVFPKAYNSLINSKISNLSDILLTMERDYAKEIEKIWETKEKTEADMKASYNQQVEARTGNLSNLMTKHYEDLELIKVTYESQIEEIKNIQKKEYHFFIENLYNNIKSKKDINSFEEIQNDVLFVINCYKEYASKNNSKITSILTNLMSKISKSNIKGKNEVKNENDVLNSPQSISHTGSPLKQTLDDQNDKNNNESDNQEINKDKTIDNQTQNENKKQNKEKQKEKKDNSNVKELLDMGFTNEQAKAALELSKNNLEQAIFYLLEKPFVVEEYIKKEKEKHKELKNTSKNSFNSMLNLTWAEKEKLITSSTTESLLPISRSLSNLNLKSTSLMSMKKLGSFFGSIKDFSSTNLSNEIKQSDEPETFVYDNPSLSEDELSETFTIYYGTQVRMMYNIRIMVQKFENLFRIPKNDEQRFAYFAQTASSLYSDNINGVIVLLTPSDWPKYAMGESANKTLIQQCKRATEFHFDDIEKQLNTIEKTLPKKDGKVILKEGDFFVTCHSNLPLIHVVFHLVVNETYNTTESFSRLKFINGYKNILSYAYKYDINNLTIPLLILPNNQINTIMEKEKKLKVKSFKNSSLNQYIEVLLKNTKVYMIESSRMIKHSLDSSGTEKNSRTLQFILPKIIDNESFYSVVDNVSKIFRTT